MQKKFEKPPISKQRFKFELEKPPISKQRFKFEKPTYFKTAV